MKNNVFIIAEIGVNHNGDINLAKEMILKAKDSGADAVKFQTFKADNLVNKKLSQAKYQQINYSQASQYKMLKKLELSQVKHKSLKQLCKKIDIEFMSSPFDKESLDFLVNEIEIRIVKVPSGEIVNPELLTAVGNYDLKTILSTGMSNKKEIDAALGCLFFGKSKNSLNKQSSIDYFQKLSKTDLAKIWLKDKCTILHCTSNYPAPSEELNLNVIKNLSKSYPCNIGYSDHSKGINASLIAVALGATVIEKHFTTNKKLPGPDHKASLSPTEFNSLVKNIRLTEEMLGSSYKKPTYSESDTRIYARRSLVASMDIPKGSNFSFKNLSFMRAGNGISPMNIGRLISTKASKAYKEGDLIVEEI